MNMTQLQRIHALADAPANVAYSDLASAARKLGGNDAAISKAAFLTKLLSDLADSGDAEKILAALESLARTSEPGA